MLRLGRRAIKTDTRTLRVGNYTAALAAPPSTKDWSGGQSYFEMMLNDQLGCCTVSGVGHAVQTLSRAAGSEVTVANDVILSYYEQWDGYDPKIPATDHGGIELDVLNDWQKNGFAGHVLKAFADVSIPNTIQVKQAIALFGGLYIGISLPESAKAQVGGVWDVAPWYTLGLNKAYMPGSWGGHCVWVCGYDAKGLTCITWGSLQRMSWAFWGKYVDEAHALLGADFIKANGVAASGFDLTALESDLAAIR